MKLSQSSIYTSLNLPDYRIFNYFDIKKFNKNNLNKYNDLLINLVDNYIENTNNTEIDWDFIYKSMNINDDISPADCYLRYYKLKSNEYDKRAWIKDDERKLLELVNKYQERMWVNISNDLGSERSAIECLRHYQRHLNLNLVNHSPWTEEEDEILSNIHISDNYNDISTHLPSRTLSQCLKRSQSALFNNDLTWLWTANEERRLLLVVLAYYKSYQMNNNQQSKSTIQIETDSSDDDGISSSKCIHHKFIDDQIDWINVAKFIPGKSYGQCRDKWYRQLDTNINTNPFTIEEDELLMSVVNDNINISNLRQEINTYLPNRTYFQCINRIKSIKYKYRVKRYNHDFQNSKISTYPHLQAEALLIPNFK